MKRLFFFIVLLSLSLNNPSKADSIQDFEIKGISLGQSLFDHFVKEDVLYYDAYGTKWLNPRFKSVTLNLKKNGKKTFSRSPKFDEIESIYDAIQITWKIDNAGNGDFNNFKVQGLSGILYYETVNNNCANDAKEVIEVFNSLLLNTNYTFDDVPEKPFNKLDNTGKSTNKLSRYNLMSGEGIMIGCTYIRNNELIKKGEKSFLRVSLQSKEVRDFLSPAGNLKDFLIEGITTNKSLLDYFSLENIQYKQFNAGTKNYLYSKFTKNTNNLEIYDELRVHYKENDSNYKIKGVQGWLYFWDKKDECLLKQKEISKEIFEDFANRDIQKLTKKVIDKTDKSKESFEIYTVIRFPKGGLIAVSCSIWSKNMKPINTLTVSIYTGDYK